MSISWRLTLWFSLILGAILLLSGASIHFLLQNYLSNDIDNNLSVHSARIHGTINFEDIQGPLDYSIIHDRLPPINEFAYPGIYIQIIDQSGKVVVKSDNLGEQQLPVDPSLLARGFSGEISIATVAAGDGAGVRVMVSPLYLQNQVLLLEVGQSLTHLQSMMRQVVWALLAGTLGALALAGVSGGVLVRRVLSPVERITQTARSIEAGADMHRRVDYHGPMDEVGRLATTFDHMLERLDRAFESQRHFVADASHELRSPLTVIRGNLDLLKRNLGEADRQQSLNTMEAEVGRMTGIVSELLLLAEVESGPIEPPAPVSLKDILIEGQERGRQLAGNRQINIGRQEAISVPGNDLRLRQLLSNLVDNAIRYTPEDGTIRLSLFRNGPWACLEVADNGPGIAPEHLPHLFDRFYRVDRARSRASGGTGLGLTIVREIAEQHRGKVTVTSQPGKGSTFTVWLKP